MEASCRENELTGRVLAMTLLANTAADEMIMTKILEVLSSKDGKIIVEIGDERKAWRVDE